jgi:hypothetical protein
VVVFKNLIALIQILKWFPGSFLTSLPEPLHPILAPAGSGVAVI